MAFGDYEYPEVLDEFGLTQTSVWNLFAAVPPVPLHPGTRQQLDRTGPLGPAIRSEKARSEWMVAPLLGDLWAAANNTVGLYSGVNFPADPAAKLTGPIDFLLTRGPQLPSITAPVAVIVEAKREDLYTGYGQCIAGMVGTQRFNKRAGLPDGPVYGASTIGSLWQFLKLDGVTVTFDLTEHPLTHADKILGILTHFVRPVPGVSV